MLRTQAPSVRKVRMKYKMFYGARDLMKQAIIPGSSQVAEINKSSVVSGSNTGKNVSTTRPTTAIQPSSVKPKRPREPSPPLQEEQQEEYQDPPPTSQAPPEEESTNAAGIPHVCGRGLYHCEHCHLDFGPSGRACCLACLNKLHP